MFSYYFMYVYIVNLLTYIHRVYLYSNYSFTLTAVMCFMHRAHSCQHRKVMDLVVVAFFVAFSYSYLYFLFVFNKFSALHWNILYSLIYKRFMENSNSRLLVQDMKVLNHERILHKIIKEASRATRVIKSLCYSGFSFKETFPQIRKVFLTLLFKMFHNSFLTTNRYSD